MTRQPLHRPRVARTARTLRVVTLAVPLALAIGVAGLVGTAVGASGSWIRVLTATGVVDGAMASYLRDGVQGAASGGAAAVVVRLDTPGGLSTAMDDIKQSFLEARVPVIVWVAPSGARAASAGTIITLAANLAFMAPATNIGAASPISSNGQDIPGTLGVKVREDAIASISALAEARGRPVAWAVSTVADARSYAASEALAAGAVDGIEATLDDVLAAADGRQVTVAGGTTITLALAGLPVQDAPMNPGLALFHLLADPNIAFLLFVLGALGLATELVHPNLLTGIMGSLALVLSFLGFSSLPLNVTGLVLVVLGFVLFVAETQFVSHGILGAAGLVCVVLGGSALYTAPLSPAEPVVSVAPIVLTVTALTVGGLMALIAIAALRARRMRAPVGQLGGQIPVGTEGIVRAALGPAGVVQLAGERWTARTPDERPVPLDTPVRLVGFDGLTALVEPIAEAPAQGTAASPSIDRSLPAQAADRP